MRMLDISPTRPSHTKLEERREEARPGESRYSLNENNGAPRTRGSARSINSNNNKVGTYSDISDNIGLKAH